MSEGEVAAVKDQLMALHRAHIGLSEALGGVRMAQLFSVDADSLGFLIEDRIPLIKEHMDALICMETKWNGQKSIQTTTPPTHLAPPSINKETFRDDLYNVEKWFGAMAERFKHRIMELIPR